MSKNPSNGFKSPAPVLPGLGLHSFHNDSPPFAPASQHAQREPEHFSLDENASPHGRASPMTHSFSGEGTAGDGGEGTAINGYDANHANHGGHPHHAHGNHIVAPVPVPIQQRGFNPNSDSLSSPQQQEQQSRPPHRREPTSSADDVLSTSRSRRLLSGYLFGNPPSPHETDDPSLTGTTSALSQPADTPAPRLEERHSSPAPGASSAAPPSQTRDSTPVSTVSSSPDRPGSGNLTARMGDADLDEASGASVDAAASQAESRRRRQSRARDREIGYDALSGLNDGEADADANAPQANFGTRPYLMGEEGPAGEYRFPRHRLRTRMKDESKIPIVIVACGSFSPPTYLHLRMFEMAKDEVVESQTYEIMAGYYSPVSSYYKKAGLAPAVHRVRMCELAVEHTSTWLMVDPWEAGQPEYTRTAVVLEHFNEMLNVQGGGLTMSDGKRRRYKIMLLAGGDLIESFGEPGVWSEPDLHIILGRFGCLIVERAGSDVWAFLLSHDILYHHRRNVIVIKQLIYNDISSTKVRLFVKRGMSIKYLLPNSVIQYIYDNKLYRAPEGLNAIGAGAPTRVEDGPIS